MSKRRPAFALATSEQKRIGTPPGMLGICVRTIKDGTIDPSMEVAARHPASNAICLQPA